MSDPRSSGRARPSRDHTRDDATALALAREAARRGAEILLANAVDMTGARPSIQRKGSAIDLVTQVDPASERVIVDVLRASDIAIVAEEGGLTRPQHEAHEGSVWYVDPLDGTTNYANGHPFHCVSIALVVDGVPRVGVVHAPLLGVVWSGSLTAGATRRDLVRGLERPLAVSTTPTLDEVLLATGFPYDRRTSSDDNLAAFAAMMKIAQGVMRCGSAAMDLAMVADGTYGGFWERKLKPWDLAAGAALVVAAGGVVTDPAGGPFRAETGAALASNGRIHDQLRLALAPHLPSP